MGGYRQEVHGTPRRWGRDRIAKRLTSIQDELAELVGERQVLVDQLVHLRGTAADASTDAVVRDTGPSVREAHAADRDVVNHQRLLDELDQRRTRLQDERDQLLDRMLETRGRDG